MLGVLWAQGSLLGPLLDILILLMTSSSLVTWNVSYILMTPIYTSSLNFKLEYPIDITLIYLEVQNLPAFAWILIASWDSTCPKQNSWPPNPLLEICSFFSLLYLSWWQLQTSCCLGQNFCQEILYCWLNFQNMYEIWPILIPVLHQFWLESPSSHFWVTSVFSWKVSVIYSSPYSPYINKNDLFRG